MYTHAHVRKKGKAHPKHWTCLEQFHRGSQRHSCKNAEALLILGLSELRKDVRRRIPHGHSHGFWKFESLAICVNQPPKLIGMI